MNYFRFLIKLLNNMVKISVYGEWNEDYYVVWDVLNIFILILNFEF